MTDAYQNRIATAVPQLRYRRLGRVGNPYVIFETLPLQK
jgi:hypothetical protein